LFDETIKDVAVGPGVLFVHFHQLQFEEEYRCVRPSPIIVSSPESLPLGDSSYPLFAMVVLLQDTGLAYSLILRLLGSTQWVKFDLFHHQCHDFPRFSSSVCTLFYSRDLLFTGLFPVDSPPLPPRVQEFAKEWENGELP
jgi:hypothetical protein